MPRSSHFQTLESRTFLSAATLTQDEMNLANAIAQLKADQTSTAATLAADHAAVKADGHANDPNLVNLRNTLKQDQLTRDNTLITDRSNLKIATNNDKITILQDRANIRADKKSGNTTQLATDQATLNSDLVKLATDRDTLGTKLEDDRVSTKATVIADKQAIVNEILTGSSNTQLGMDKQKLINDEMAATTTLADDRKTIFADRLIVAQDKHG